MRHGIIPGKCIVLSLDPIQDQGLVYFLLLVKRLICPYLLYQFLSVHSDTPFTWLVKMLRKILPHLPSSPRVRRISAARRISASSV